MTRPSTRSSAWLASLPRKGFVLVPISAIVKENARGGDTG